MIHKCLEQYHSYDLEDDLGKLGHLSAYFRFLENILQQAGDRTMLYQLVESKGYLHAEKCGVGCLGFAGTDHRTDHVREHSWGWVQSVKTSPMSSSSEWKSVQLYFEQPSVANQFLPSMGFSPSTLW